MIEHVIFGSESPGTSRILFAEDPITKKPIWSPEIADLLAQTARDKGYTDVRIARYLFDDAKGVWLQEERTTP